MVNIIPAGNPFYPTDHCGVLRVKTDDILPKYLAIALEVEGAFEKFSRHNRASTQRIMALTIQVPEDKKKQQAIIDEITTFEENEKRTMIRLCNLLETLKTNTIKCSLPQKAK